MAGPAKKGKSSKQGKSTKGKESKPKELKRSSSHQDDLGREALVAPQERVQAVRPFWETVLQEERQLLLTASVEALRERAKELAIRQRKQAAQEEAELAAEIAAGAEPIPGTPLPPEPTMDEVLEEGLSRLQNKPTWKLWHWPLDGEEFYDADSFRQHVEEKHIDEALRRLLPRDEGRPVERPAEEALRKRMADLLQKVHQNTRQLQDEVTYSKRVSRGPRATSDQIHSVVRDTNIELITIILQALEQEHEFLYHAVLFPVTSFVCEMLPEGSRDSSRAELFFEDLDKLVPEDVARICEWLTEKVDGFSAKLKPEAKEIQEEDEENGIGDVDLFTLSEDKAELTVNAKWLQHLQERLLGEDGHPRKVQESEDPHQMGLVLEWVYGTIVSTAEKARDGAKRSLGVRPPTAQQAHDLLVSALQDQAGWEARAVAAKELLNQMVKSRREATLLSQSYDIKPVPTPAAPGTEASPESTELPDAVIEAMLRRELLLTNAKLHGLGNEHITSERKLRSLRTQLRQGEPGFERLKRELEEVKNAPRGLEGTFRTAAEMERHRAQAADAAIEEQLEVQTAFREHGARLQGIYEHKQRTEHDIARREQEMKQLQGWKGTVTNLLEKFGKILAAAAAKEDDGAMEEDASPSPSLPSDALEGLPIDIFGPRLSSLRSGAVHDRAKIRLQFHKEVRRQLYSDKDDRAIFSTIQGQLRNVEKRLEEGRAALQHLEMGLINVACDDPGAAIGAHLALPLLQERLDAQALLFADKRAVEAEEDIIRMETARAERSAQEREKKLKAKQKIKDKLRTEKERAAAEREARLREDEEAALAAAKARDEAEVVERLRKIAEAEAARAAQEALMEARRLELLSEKDGYWSKRMAQDEARAAVLAAEEDADGAESSASDDTTWREESEQDPALSQKRNHHPQQPRRSSTPRLPLANGHAPHLAASSPGRPSSAGRLRNGVAEGEREGSVRKAGGPRKAVGAPAQRAGISRSSSSLSDRSAQSQEVRGDRRGDTRGDRRQPTILVIPKSTLVPPEASRPVSEPPPQPSTTTPPVSKPATPTTPVRKESSVTSSAAGRDDLPSAAAAAVHAELVRAEAESAAELPEPAADHTDSAAVSQASEPPAANLHQEDAAAQVTPSAPVVPEAQRPMLQFGSEVPNLAPAVGPVSLPTPKSTIPDHLNEASSPFPVPLPVPTAHVELQEAGSGPPRQAGPAGLTQQPVPLHVPPPRMQMLGQTKAPSQGDAVHMNGMLLPHPSAVPPLTRTALPAGPRPLARMPQGGLGNQSPSTAIHQGMRASGLQPPLPEAASGSGAMNGKPGDLMQPRNGLTAPGGPPFATQQQQQQQQQPPYLMSPPRLASGAPLKPFGHPPHLMNGPMRAQNTHPMTPKSPLPLNSPTSPGAYVQQRHHPALGGPSFLHGPQMAPMSGPAPLPMSMMGQSSHAPPFQQHSGQLAMGVAMAMGNPSLPNQHLSISPRALTAASHAHSRSSSGGLPGSALPRPTTALRANAQPFVPGGLRGASATPAASTASSLEPQQGSHVPDALSALQHQQQQQQQPQSSLAGPAAGEFQASSHVDGAQPEAGPSTSGTDEAAQSSHILSQAAAQHHAAPPDLYPGAVSNARMHAHPSTSSIGSEPGGQLPKAVQSQASPSSATFQTATLAQEQLLSQRANQQGEVSVADEHQRKERTATGREASTSRPAGLPPGGDRHSITRAGGVVWEGFARDLHRVHLVRGLRNDTGLNDCFLNVVIQSLWHLQPFRRALLSLDMQLLHAASNEAEKNVRVLQALRNIFDAFATPLDAAAAVAESDSNVPDGEGAAKRARTEEPASSLASGRGWTVSPRELREALSSLGSAAIQADLSEMQDAAEVLGEIFASLHMAEVGSAAEGAADPQLPQRIRLTGKQRPAYRQLPSSIVLDIFGLEVQVQAPSPSSDEPAGMTKRSKGSLGAAPVGIWQEVPVRSSSPHAHGTIPNGHAQSQPSSPAAESLSRESPPTAPEVLHFVKYCHLVPAQGLRSALHRLNSSSSFENLLCCAERADSSPASRALPELLPISLLRRPKIFTLGIVWESVQASTQAIAAAVDAVSQSIDVGRVFRDVPSGPGYILRGIICYFSHHYQALALSEELDEWLLFDDTHIKQIGSWADAAAVMKNGRLQPSLLFYEQLQR